jgi:hypothetical protein
LTISSGSVYLLSEVYDFSENNFVPTTVFWLALSIHAVVAVLFSFATTKHSGEFQRHFIRGDDIIDATRGVYIAFVAYGAEKPSNKQIAALNGLFDALKLETSTQWYEGQKHGNRWFINLSRIWSASRSVIYFYSGIIAADLALAAFFLAQKFNVTTIQDYVLSAAVFILVFQSWSLLLVKYLQHIAKSIGVTVCARDISRSMPKRWGFQLGMSGSKIMRFAVACFHRTATHTSARRRLKGMANESLPPKKSKNLQCAKGQDGASRATRWARRDHGAYAGY